MDMHYKTGGESVAGSTSQYLADRPCLLVRQLACIGSDTLKYRQCGGRCAKEHLLTFAVF
jgi:hypothetical protein